MLTQSLLAGTSDFIDLTTNIAFNCEIDILPEAIASNLDITQNQSHLKLFTLNMAGNDQTLFTVDMPNEEKLMHNSMLGQYFSFASLDYNLATNISGSSSSSSGNLSFPQSQSYPISFPGNGFTFSEDIFANYTGVPALSLVQGVYSATWHFSCGPMI